MLKRLLFSLVILAIPFGARAQEMDHSHHGAPPVQTAAVQTPASGQSSAPGSGTSRLPAGEGMHGLHVMTGDWMLMAHGYAWGVYSDQGGPRGNDEAFVASMAMVEASRPLGDR